MADTLISAGLAGQPGAPAADTAAQQTAEPQAQPQGNYVTSEQLNAVVDELKRTIQSSTDKSYNRVQKMIDNLKQAGIQNPTYEQAQALMRMQDSQSEQQETQAAAQPQQSSAASSEAAAWIQRMGGDPSKDFWSDIYDAAQEAGVENITSEDPEYQKYFVTEGKLRNFDKPRQFVRAFEQAFADKANRLKAAAQETETGNPASSPALGSIGNKSSYIDPKTNSANNLISQGLHQKF